MNAKFYFSILVFVLMCEFTFAQDNRVAYLEDPELTAKNNLKHTDNKIKSIIISVQNYLDEFQPVKSSFGTAFYAPLDQTSTYDVQSDRTQIWEDPFTPVNVHITLMYSIDSNYAGRKCAYYFSNDRGYTWGLVGNLAEVSSGFPTITGLDNGSAVIACQGQFDNGPERTNLFVDLGAGFGAFMRLDPGNNLSSSYLWPAISKTSIGQLAFVASGNINTTTNLNPPGLFTGYNPYGGHKKAYDLAVSPTGKLGHVYIGNTLTDIGDVFFRESIDNGVSWSIPKKIWDYGITKSLLGCLNGVSMIYGNNNVPYIVFETIRMQPEGGFYPGLPSKIRVWSPIINNGTSKIIADENNVPFFPNTGIVSDGFAPICRPVIGKAGFGENLFIAFNSTSGNVSPHDSSVFYSIYITYSFDGQNWFSPERVTPLSPIRDWRYVSISKTNHWFGGKYPFFHLFTQVDEVPGSYVHGGQFSRAKYCAINVEIIVGENEGSTNIPEIFSLNENYPNPFNPETNIKYDLSKSSFISLKIFDISGKLLETLFKGKQDQGIYTFKWNADNYPSGVYFYELRSENYVETKRMMLLK